jgi:hypothetical protein
MKAKSMFTEVKKLPNLPEQKRAMLGQLVATLSRVPGMCGVVLGGSYASGTQHENSDMDVGLYYLEASPFSIDAIRLIANEFSIDGTPTVTGFYGWGAWVNGGAWIQTPVGKVDFLYRNIDQVQKTIRDAQQGISHHDYDQQPVHGFFSVIYLAETQICLPLYDPELWIADLKRSVDVYPPLLKKKVIADSLWSAEFTLLHARGFAAQGDIYNTVGCLTRAASNLTQALFALNEKYFLRDKKVLETIAGFPNLPSGYIQQIHRILAFPGGTAEELTRTVRDLEQAWHTVVSLPGVDYKPKFEM